MKFNKIIAGTSAAALSLTMVGTAMAATDNDTINLQVEVQETLTFDCYDTVGGTGDYNVDLGTVTAGTPVTASSRCDVTTNDDSGYYVTVVNASTAGSTGDVLEHQDPHTGTWYSITDKAEIRTTAAVYSGTGLGYSVNVIPETGNANNTINSDWTVAACGAGTEVYAGIPDSAEVVSAVVTYQAGQTTTDVCYQVDVPATQQSGIYTGSVV
jgi:hypothetical protein